MTLASKHERLSGLRPLSPAAVRSLAEAWEVRMIYESNSIEGNSLTLRETEIVLSKGVTVSGKPLKDHLEAVNLSKAWERLKALALPATELTERDLLDLHEIIMGGIDESGAGSYRTSAVRIAGSNHVPPNAVKVPDLMADLFADLSADPVERAARLHHGVSAIHPFNDGNGRAARLAMNFVLIAAGYPPVSISPEIRGEYYAALEAADAGDFATWQAFISRHVEAELDIWLDALTEN
ncbi:Fic family protein [Haloferula sargassicola]|uniref:Fido domain-containing protein n=1 Tax=Haloferula sargassicola TaxID=490096 RepID=A0ABP9UM08_9BACT